MKKFDIELLKKRLNNRIDFYNSRIEFYKNGYIDDTIESIISDYNNLIHELKLVLIDIIEVEMLGGDSK